MDSKQGRIVQKFLNELKKYRGRHTSLVSVYIPAGYDIVKIIQHLAQEQGTATNIKDAITRKNVIDALEKMIQHLRLYHKTPEHGLAVFSGNVSDKEGGVDLQVWSLEPPEPVTIRLYRCDKDFKLEFLQEMADKKECYGLVVMDRRDARIALLRGKSIVPLSHTSSAVPGKFKAGGQSSQRFERLIEGAAKEFYKKVAEYMRVNFLENNQDVKGIIIGGPGRSKNEMIEQGLVTDQVNRKIIAIKDLSYTGDFGLQELVEKSADVLANEEVSKEKNLMQRFFEYLAKNQKMVSYGIKEVKRLLEIGAVDILLISEDLDNETTEQLEKIAESLGTNIEFISTETREGVQLRDLGKVAAILRYEAE
ncbi:MAG: peptide chain release factor aRF-1 [archaeon]